MMKFEVGKSYETRSIADWECIFSFTILDRTDKTITTIAHGKRVKRGLKTVDGVEQFKPFGSYSMCPIIRANKERA